VSTSGPEQDLLELIETGQADRRVLLFAARGFVPLPPGELARAVASLIRAGDPELSPLAEQTFASFDEEALKAAIGSDGVTPEELDVIARRSTEPRVLEPLIRHRSIADASLIWLAERVEPHLQDVLVTNQIRLLKAPSIVEKLFENPNLSADIRRRADEFLEEFFLKKERERDAEEEAARARSEAAAAATPRPEASPPSREEAEEPELSEEERKNLFARLISMTVAQKIQLAYRGTKEERLFLVRDTNRLVALAVLKSPKTREADAEAIANMKNVSEDVLRGIARRREWMKRYVMVAAIVKNPRSPIDVTLPLVPRLTPRDHKLLVTDRNVPEAIRSLARRELARRE